MTNAISWHAASWKVTQLRDSMAAMRTVRTLLLVLGLAALAMGCGGKNKKSDTAGGGDGSGVGDTHAGNANKGSADTGNGGAKDPNLQDVVYFEFDKSDLMPADIEALAKVAECFSTGPLKNDNMQLVGRADPRGSTEYNDALGMRRADTVANFLVGKGIATGRIEKTSRGERDATGTDEASYAKDRRVDVMRVEIRLSKR